MSLNVFATVQLDRSKLPIWTSPDNFDFNFIPHLKRLLTSNTSKNIASVASVICLLFHRADLLTSNLLDIFKSCSRVHNVHTRARLTVESNPTAAHRCIAVIDKSRTPVTVCYWRTRVCSPARGILLRSAVITALLKELTNWYRAGTAIHNRLRPVAGRCFLLRQEISEGVSANRATWTCTASLGKYRLMHAIRQLALACERQACFAVCMSWLLHRQESTYHQSKFFHHWLHRLNPNNDT